MHTVHNVNTPKHGGGASVKRAQKSYWSKSKAIVLKYYLGKTESYPYMNSTLVKVLNHLIFYCE